MNCCTSGLSDVFTDDVSRKDADRYRKRGLPPRAQRLVAAIQSVIGLKNKKTLEIGVGAGAVTVEMLRRGAGHATGVDAVAAQLANARTLAGEFEVADRAEFVLGNFPDVDVASADILVLDRVICCYPQWEPMLTAAATHSRSVLAMTYPRDVWWMRTTRHAMNFWRWVLRSDFRFYVHPPVAMHALLTAQGFTPRVTGRHFAWEILIAQRP